MLKISVSEQATITHIITKKSTVFENQNIQNGSHRLRATKEALQEGTFTL